MAVDSPSPIPQRQSSGLTLIELLLALAITGVIGGAVATLLYATGNATASRNDMRAVVVRQMTLDSRLTAAIRSSRMVLVGAGDHLVLWMGDTNPDNQPNLSELRRIEFNSATGQIIAYKTVFPNTWTAQQIAAADTGYPLAGTNFDTLTSGLKGQSTFPAEVWGVNLGSVSFSYNKTNMQQVTLVGYRATLKTGPPLAMTGAASLRNNGTSSGSGNLAGGFVNSASGANNTSSSASRSGGSSGSSGGSNSGNSNNNGNGNNNGNNNNNNNNEND